MTEIKQNIKTIESLIEDPSKGLPEDLFLFVSKVTPMVNVDLLIKDERGRTLLTWRDDRYSGKGWHIPGGIIRFGETISDRIKAVSRSEIGAEVDFQQTPIVINEIIHPSRKERGHFISLLYRCSLTTLPDESLHYESGTPKPSQWVWHEVCPENIISVHEIYRRFI